jgi:acetyl esterase
VDEGVLDPWAAEWLAANPLPSLTESAEMLALARGPFAAPPTREISSIVDEMIDGVPVRIYRNDGTPTGLVVYFHGGGWCIGSIDIMDNVARELAHATGSVVISVGYRLAPEHPFPAGLDDCEAVTRWALANASRFGVGPTKVVVAGESAGGNLATAVSLRLRGALGDALAGQVLIYPAVDSNASTHASRAQFVGIVITAADGEFFWSSYTGNRRELDHDGFAAPLQAQSLAGLPPALIILGGCDLLRDEGRQYAARLRAEGVDATDTCYPGQPHGFMNFMFPAAGPAFEQIGAWTRALLAKQPA